jgi:hypothetical protein
MLDSDGADLAGPAHGDRPTAFAACQLRPFAIPASHHGAIPFVSHQPPQAIRHPVVLRKPQLTAVTGEAGTA